MSALGQERTLALRKNDGLFAVGAPPSPSEREILILRR